MTAGATTVLIAPQQWGELPAPALAAAMAEGWRSRNDAVEILTCPQTDGGAGWLDAIADSHPDATAGAVTVPGPDGQAVPLPYLEVEVEGARTTYLTAATGLGRSIAPDPSAGYGLGQALRALIASGATRLVIGLGGAAAIDGGVALVAGLADLDAADIEAARTDPAVARAAREVLRPHRLVAAYDTSIGLLGLNGAAANAQEGLGLSAAAAQEAEAAMGAWAQHLQRVLPAGTDLLSGAPHRTDRAAGAGAGGGLGFALAVLGARLRPAPEVSAEATGLLAAIDRAHLVVTGTQIFDWRGLSDGVVAYVGRQATAAARPALILAGRVDVGRRELMSLGYAGSYAAVANPRTPLPRTAPEVMVAAQALAHRVAGTWTPRQR